MAEKILEFINKNNAGTKGLLINTVQWNDVRMWKCENEKMEYKRLRIIMGVHPISL